MQTITIRRISPELIEYEVIEGRTFHADPKGTFIGPHDTDTIQRTKQPTLWRATDADMLDAFRAQYPDAEILL